MQMYESVWSSFEAEKNNRLPTLELNIYNKEGTLAFFW